MVFNYSVVATFGRMLADKQEDGSGASPQEPDKAYNAKDFVVATRAIKLTFTRRLRHQPDLPLAGREGVQPNRPSIVLQPMVIIRQVVAKCPKRE
jgi:hypothetical protein